MKHIKLFENFSDSDGLDEARSFLWTPEKIRQEFNDGDYVNRFDLQRKNKNLYQAALRNNMLDEFFDKFDHGNRKWTPEKIRQEFNDGDYPRRNDLATKNPALYHAAYNRKMLDEFFDKQGVQIKWDTEKIRKEIVAGDYLNKADLHRKNRKLYGAAYRFKMLDDFFDS